MLVLADSCVCWKWHQMSSWLFGMLFQIILAAAECPQGNNWPHQKILFNQYVSFSNFHPSSIRSKYNDCCCTRRGCFPWLAQHKGGRWVGERVQSILPPNYTGVNKRGQNKTDRNIIVAMIIFLMFSFHMVYSPQTWYNSHILQKLKHFM